MLFVASNGNFGEESGWARQDADRIQATKLQYFQEYRIFTGDTYICALLRAPSLIIAGSSSSAGSSPL